MSNNGSSVTDKAGEIARNIWLAGIGAYGRAVEEAQQRPGAVPGETSGLFRDLVMVGATLEEQVLDDTSDVRHSTRQLRQVSQHRATQSPDVGTELARINSRLEDLQHTLDSLENKLDSIAGRQD